MAAIEAVILYVQLTLGIANPTSADIQKASYDLNGTTTTTTQVATAPTSSNTSGGWDIYEGN
jgi:hypothetical protein